jgi:hypothetical protein
VSYDQKPFEDVVLTPDGLTLPELKWRELHFIGALRQDGDAFVRDPARPMPPFARGDLLPFGARFAATPEGRRVRLRRLS